MSHTTGSGINPSLRSVKGDIIPLTGVAVEGCLAGPFLSVTMKQRWTNSASVPLEVLWHFPLPAGAVVRSLAVERKGKRQEAKVETRDKAFEAYDRALDEGSRAALLDAETEGVLSLRLGNLDANDSMLVEVSWVQIVEETAGSLRVSIPTSIAPRYFPANWKDDSQIPREERLSLPWASMVPYGISVSIGIEDPAQLGEITSPSHQLSIVMAENRMQARLGGDFSAMDRDFVLDVMMKADRPATAWMDQWKDTSWLAADLRLPETKKRETRNIAFLIDVSGSMAGESLSAAKTAMKAALGALGKGDHFGLFAFSDSVSDGQQEPLYATQENVVGARHWIDSLETSGGTELAGALDHVWNKGSWTDVLVLTDGDVGDDAGIARMAETRLKAGTRLHILGIGSAPAGDAIFRIAHAGGGTSSTIHPNEKIAPKVLSVVSSILTGFAEGFSLKASAKDCDLASPVSGAMGTRIRILARMPGEIPDTSYISLAAQTGTENIRMELPVSTHTNPGEGQGALAALWAQARISHRSDELAKPRPDSKKTEELTAELEELALSAGILSTVTSLILVDESGQKVEGSVRFLEVPIAIPHGYGAANFSKVNLAISLKSIDEFKVAVEDLPSILELSESMTAPYRCKIGKAHFDSFGGIVEPRWWDILTLQIPGGGFGPIEEVLDLLGIGKGTVNPEDYRGNNSGRILSTALCLSWLDMKCSRDAAIWEPLVDQSRQYLAKKLKWNPVLTTKAMELARKAILP